MSKKDKPLDDGPLDEEGLESGPSSFFPESRPGMGKEVKIGLGVILMLLTVFGVLLVNRLRRPADTPAVAEEAGKEKGEAGSAKPATPTFVAAKTSTSTPGGGLSKWSTGSDNSRFKDQATEVRSAPAPSFMPKQESFGSSGSNRFTGYSTAASDSPRPATSSPSTLPASSPMLGAAASSPGSGSAGPGSSSPGLGSSLPGTANSNRAASSSLPSAAANNASAGFSMAGDTRPSPGFATTTAPSSASTSPSLSSAASAPASLGTGAMTPVNRPATSATDPNPLRSLNSSTGTAAPTSTSTPANAATSGDYRGSSLQPYSAGGMSSTAAPSAYSGLSGYRNGLADSKTIAAPSSASSAPQLAATPATYADPAAGARPTTGTYTVQPNENYWAIAQRVYGNGAYYMALAEHNRKKIPDENRLAVGDVIAAPSVAELEKYYPSLCPKTDREKTTIDRSPLSNVSSRGAGGRVYVVQEGDNLFNIARYELHSAARWVEIYELNRDTIGDQIHLLRPGMKLSLPEAPSTVRTATPGGLLRK